MFYTPNTWHFMWLRSLPAFVLLSHYEFSCVYTFWDFPESWSGDLWSTAYQQIVFHPVCVWMNIVYIYISISVHMCISNTSSGDRIGIISICSMHCFTQALLKHLSLMHKRTHACTHASTHAHTHTNTFLYQHIHTKVMQHCNVCGWHTAKATCVCLVCMEAHEHDRLM